MTCELCGERDTFDREVTEQALADRAADTPPDAG